MVKQRPSDIHFDPPGVSAQVLPHHHLGLSSDRRDLSPHVLGDSPCEMRSTSGFLDEDGVSPR